MSVVAVVIPHLSHYRQEVYEALQRSSRNEYAFFGDLTSWQGIESVDQSRIANVQNAKLREFGRLRWQHLRAAGFRVQDYQAIVFLGDANVLTTWIYALYARARGVKVLFWTTGWHRPDRSIRRRIRLLFYRFAHHLLLYSDSGKRLALEMGYPPSNTTVIYNSVPLRSSQSEIRDLSEVYTVLSDGKINLGAVIRLNPAKALDYLIKAVAKLPDYRERYRVVFVGAGPDGSRLRDIAEALDVDCLILDPIYDRTSLSAIYAQMSLTVIPKLAGLSVIQSMSFGVPVISDDDIYGQAPESEAIVHGVTGALYRADDIEDLAEQIHVLVQSLEEPNRAAVYRKACLDEVEARWTGDSQASKIDAVISSIT